MLYFRIQKLGQCCGFYSNSTSDHIDYPCDYENACESFVLNQIEKKLKLLGISALVIAIVEVIFEK